MDLQPNKSDAILKPITNTRISASEWNQLVGSCMAFISAAGFSPDAADNEQFLNAFKKIASELELVGANTALSNLTSEGQGKFDAKANVSLDNLNDAGDIVGSNLGMPDNTKIDELTFGASGTVYTAPASGYFIFSIAMPANAYFAIFRENNTSIVNLLDITVSTTQQNYIAKTPVLVGQRIRIQYNNATNNSSRFYYAKGSETLKV